MKRSSSLDVLFLKGSLYFLEEREVFSCSSAESLLVVSAGWSSVNQEQMTQIANNISLIIALLIEHGYGF